MAAATVWKDPANTGKHLTGLVGREAKMRATVDRLGLQLRMAEGKSAQLEEALKVTLVTRPQYWRGDVTASAGLADGASGTVFFPRG